MQFDDDGYEWHETTTQEEKAAGHRSFIRGRRLDRAAELADGIRGLANDLESRVQSPGAQKIARELRALL